MKSEGQQKANRDTRKESLIKSETHSPLSEYLPTALFAYCDDSMVRSPTEHKNWKLILKYWAVLWKDLTFITWHQKENSHMGEAKSNVTTKEPQLLYTCLFRHVTMATDAQVAKDF